MLRSVICSFVGHIDHGKTSLLDSVRGTAVTKSEAGGITQCISCTNVNFETIKKICKNLKGIENIKIPGLLFLDTPGHAAFNNLRKRGGNLADIAVVVIDVNEGIKEQSIEVIKILQEYKTPFVVALNKIDLIPGWKPQKGLVLNSINLQSENVKIDLDNKLYTIVGKLNELGFNSERFDRVNDYTKQIAIVPTSAETLEGTPELLFVISGLAQRFLEKKLEVNLDKPGKGTILEVKEEKGLGTTLDVIIYDGKIKTGDQIVIGGLEKPIVTKVKALLQPEKGKLKSIKEVLAAAGVKISALDLDEVVAGMPIQVANKNIEEIKKTIQEEIEEVILDLEGEGVVIKADTLGSLEALIGLLQKEGIPIKKASVGDINKKDIMAAKAEKDPLNQVVLGFNVATIDSDVKIIENKVIYKIIEDYQKWKNKTEKALQEKELERLVRPCKLEILTGCIFRQSNPAVVGVSVEAGVLKTGTPLIKLDGSKIGEVKEIQHEKENITTAEKGKQIAISLPDATVGRHIEEGDILLSDIPEENFIKLKKLKSFLGKDEISVMKELAEIKRKQNPVWGV